MSKRPTILTIRGQLGAALWVLTVSSATRLVCSACHRLRGETPNYVYRDCEIKILRTCCAHRDQAEQSAVIVENRTTRIPWIYRGLHLKHVGLVFRPILVRPSWFLLIWLITPVL